jgi:predicted Zn-dependent protease
MMRPFLVALLLSILPAAAEDSLVPRNEWIDRAHAQLDLAREVRTVSPRAALPLYRSLRDDPKLGAEARAELVDCLRALGDLAGAEHELEGLLSREPGNRRLRLQLADVLAAQGHARRSREEFERALAGVPESDSAWLAYAGRMNEWGDFRRAEAIQRTTLRASPDDPALTRALAATLAGRQQFEEAAAVLQKHLRKHPRDAAAWNALASTWRGAKEFTRARYAEEHARALGWRKDSPAPASTSASSDPEFFPAQMQHAEQLAADGNYKEAIRALDELEAGLPGNYKIELTRARVKSWAHDYAGSLAAYDELLAQDPADPVAHLEKARVAAWSKNMTASQRAYRELWADPVDDELLARWQAERPAVPSPGWERVTAALAIAARKSQPAAAYELLAAPATLAALAPSEASHARALLADLEGRYRRQQSAWLEARAKRQAWEHHFLRASRTLRELTTLQQGNQEAWFDAAQAQNALGLTAQSGQAYDSLLAIEPLHQLAVQGCAQLATKSDPAALASYWYWDEKGSGRLSDITRQRIRAGGELPLAGSQFKVRAFAETWLEQPGTPPTTYVAQGFSLEAEGALNEWLSFNAHYAFKAYDDPALAPTNTGGATASFNLDDYAIVSLGYAREDELHNQFGLFQGTQSDNYAVEARSSLAHWLEVDAKFVLRDYSDANWQQDGRVDIAFLLLDHPHTLKLVFTGQYLNTQHENIFITDATGQTTNVIYPYWTPRTYFRGLVGLEWRHDLARDVFAGSAQHYYGIVVRGGEDTDLNPSISVQAEYVIDFAKHWTLQAIGGVERSPQWNGASLFTSLSYRF